MSVTFLFQDGDIELNPNTGRIKLVAGNHKLAQEVAYTLLTATDEERNIGCGIKTIENLFSSSNLAGGDSARLYVTKEVSDGIDRLRTNQLLRPSLIDDTERIAGIQQLVVYKDSANSLAFYVAVEVEQGDVLPFAYKVKLGQQFPPNSTKSILADVVTDDTRL